MTTSPSEIDYKQLKKNELWAMYKELVAEHQDLVKEHASALEELRNKTAANKSMFEAIEEAADELENRPPITQVPKDDGDPYAVWLRPDFAKSPWAKDLDRAIRSTAETVKCSEGEVMVGLMLESLTMWRKIGPVGMAHRIKSALNRYRAGSTHYRP